MALPVALKLSLAAFSILAVAYALPLMRLTLLRLNGRWQFSVVLLGVAVLDQTGREGEDCYCYTVPNWRTIYDAT